MIVIFSHQLLAEAVDAIVGQSMLLRSMLGLPPRDIGDAMDDSKSSAFDTCVRACNFSRHISRTLEQGRWWVMHILKKVCTKCGVTVTVRRSRMFPWLRVTYDA